MMQMRLLYIYTLRQTRTAQEYEKSQRKGHQAKNCTCRNAPIGAFRMIKLIKSW